MSHAQLKELVTELYKSHGLEITPTFPRVLVRILPREQESKGGIILPEFKQNKPTEEGVVLKTYPPFWQTIASAKVPERFDVKNKDLELDKNGYIKKVYQESVAQPGDHIIFPHMAEGITPVWPLDDGKGIYKMIPEWHILGKVTYEQEKLKDVLESYIEDDILCDEIAENLLANFDIIRKDLGAKVISGK